MKPFLSLLILGATVIVSCGEQKKNDAGSDYEALDLSSIDTTIKPTDDFYGFFSNKWDKNTVIPETESSWGPFNQLRIANVQKLKLIAEEVSKKTGHPKGSPAQMVGDFYFSGMDSATIEAKGFKALEEQFAMIDAIKNGEDIQTVFAKLNDLGVYPGFATGVGQDDKKSEEMIINISQSGTGLPDREYYTSKDPASKQIQDAYKTHIKKTFLLMGKNEKEAASISESIFGMEYKMAEAGMNNVEMRDPNSQYNKYHRKDLVKLGKEFNWEKYFNGLGVSPFDSVIVAQPKFVAKFNEMLKTTGIEEWKNYFKWALVEEFAPYLHHAAFSENFSFFGTTLSGVKTPKPRWERIVSIVDRSIGDAMGQLFVEKYFSAESKKKVNEMVDHLMDAYKERIKQLDWMSEATKQKALEKLSKFDRKLGYPDKWKDYSSITISRDNFMANVMAARKFAVTYNRNKLGKPVDHKEWGMTPATVNAYYNPGKNEIVFPAGIMQPPFFDPKADDAVNYASIGAVIGHELTHGFDDQGAQFDGDGNLKNWWTEEDNKKFREKANLLIHQYSSYVAVDTFHVNGNLTIGENIADLGGLTMAYYAFKRSQEGKESPKINGFTPEQRFFLAWAQIWRVKYRDAFLKQMVQTNPHSPGRFRVNGPLTNMQEFYDAFGAKPGDKMVKDEKERARIW